MSFSSTAAATITTDHRAHQPKYFLVSVCSYTRHADASGNGRYIIDALMRGRRESRVSRAVDTTSVLNCWTQRGLGDAPQHAASAADEARREVALPQWTFALEKSPLPLVIYQINFSLHDFRYAFMYQLYILPFSGIFPRCSPPAPPTMTGRRRRRRRYAGIAGRGRGPEDDDAAAATSGHLETRVHDRKWPGRGR